jgi:hypothetical protein
MSENRFTVSQTIQSPGNEPVEVRWVTDGTEIQAASSVVQILSQHDDTTAPPSVRPLLLGITVTRTGIEAIVGDRDSDPCLVCNSCGEAFDDLRAAHEHGTSSPRDMTWCGDEGFSMVPRSEAF